MREFSRHILANRCNQESYEESDLPKQVIKVKATPNAKREQIKIEPNEAGEDIYRVFIHASPDKGKANKSVIALLAKHFGVTKSSITIVKGETSREKIVEIGGA